MEVILDQFATTAHEDVDTDIRPLTIAATDDNVYGDA